MFFRWSFSCAILYILCVKLFVRCENVTSTTECGKARNSLNYCFNSSADVAESMFFSTKNIPLTTLEINGRCKVFTGGMICVNAYLSKCLDDDRKNMILNDLYGAKKLFYLLCHNQKFKQDFILHSSCLRYLEADWKRCSHELDTIIRDDINNAMMGTPINTIFLQLCCTRHAFEMCIFNSAKYKCKINSARFLRNVAGILSTAMNLKNCNKISSSFCSNDVDALHLDYIIISACIALKLYILMFYEVSYAKI